MVDNLTYIQDATDDKLLYIIRKVRVGIGSAWESKRTRDERNSTAYTHDEKPDHRVRIPRVSTEGRPRYA